MTKCFFGTIITATRIQLQLEVIPCTMSKLEKAKKRISLRPNDYTYSEARSLLTKLGFCEFNKGKTSGSRIKFYRVSDGKMILLHKPHPGDEMSQGAIEDLANFLENLGEI